MTDSSKSERAFRRFPKIFRIIRCVDNHDVTNQKSEDELKSILKVKSDYNKPKMNVTFRKREQKKQDKMMEAILDYRKSMIIHIQQACAIVVAGL